MSAPLRSFRAMRRRLLGFNLIEVAIIMVVTGLIAGAVVIPVAQLLRDDGYEWQERQMTLIQEAILGYAALHRTPHNVVVEVAGNAGFPDESPAAFYGRTYNLPAGRPYLPCPDVNGDGYEDRVDYGVAGEIPQGALEPLALRQTLTLRVGAPTTTGSAVTYNSQVEALGRCAFSRGLLPWLSLGVPPADRWGNAYTYQVDDIFADSLAGFNQNSKTAEFEIRARIDVEGSDAYLPRGMQVPRGFGFRTASDAASSVLVSFVEVGGPVVVCDGTLGPKCYPPARNAPRPDSMLTLAAGQQTSLAFAAQYRDYVANAVTEGVPYAVISHGRNGHGAVNHARLAELKRVGGSNGLNASQIACNWPIHDNASSFTMPDHLNAEAVNFPNANSGPFSPVRPLCRTSLTDSGNNNLVHRFVMWEPPREGRGDNGTTFDDLVVWTEREKLLDLFTHNRTFPAPDYPAFRPH